LRFTVHRPPCGEVSLCWYRPSGGDVAGSVHIGVTRPQSAGDAREDRLALAVFGRDVPAGGALLRRERGRHPLDAARGFVVEAVDQPAPRLAIDCAVEAPLLRNLKAWMVERAARGATHGPHVEGLHANGVEPSCQIGGGLFHPVASPVGFARFESGDRQLGARSAVGAAFRACEALLQAAQPDPLTGCQARGVQQLAGGQCRRHRHAAIDTDHAAIPRPADRVGDVREGDMPTPGAIPRDAIRLHIFGHGPGPAESDPSDLGHPHPPVAPVELFDVALLEADLAETFMHAGFAPRRATMGAREEVLHGLREIPQCLLLHRLRSGCKPAVFSTDLGQLRRLFVVPRGATSWLPKLLLLHGQVPYEPGMPAMLQQHHLLSKRRQQPKPRHTRNLATATDTNRQRTPAYAGIGVPFRNKGRGVSSMECG
jgi:hypothetical protein